MIQLVELNNLIKGGKMIFKQAILKEEKIKFGIGVGSVAFVELLIFVLELTHGDFMFRLSVIFLPCLVLMICIGLNYLEWYCIFDDRIEAKCIYGVKNAVYYNEVKSIKETSINLTARGFEKTFYIFDDGRKNNNNFFDVNSCYNRKKYNLRIYKTKKLESFVLNSLKLNVDEH